MGAGNIQTTTPIYQDDTTRRLSLRAHKEPYVDGSLRPSYKTLEILEGNIVVATIAEGRTTFSPKSEYVKRVLSAMESILPPPL